MIVLTRASDSSLRLPKFELRPATGGGVPSRVNFQLFLRDTRCVGLERPISTLPMFMSKIYIAGQASSAQSESQGILLSADEANKLRGGDSRAWKEIYDAYYPRIKRHITYMIHRADVAEDLAQDVFVQAMKSIEKFEGRSSLSTWIFSIANRLVYKHWRSSGRRERAYSKVHQGEPEFVDEDPGRSHLSKQRAQALREVLTRLPDNLREAFILVDVQRLKSAEAAQRLGISKGNLAVRASRARVKIREELEKDGWIEVVSPKGKAVCS